MLILQQRLKLVTMVHSGSQSRSNKGGDRAGDGRIFTVFGDICWLCRRPANNSVAGGFATLHSVPPGHGGNNSNKNILYHKACVGYSNTDLKLQRAIDERCEVGLAELTDEDVVQELQRCQYLSCSICGLSGASLQCCHPDCCRWFHFPCARAAAQKDGQSGKVVFDSHTRAIACPQHMTGILEPLSEPQGIWFEGCGGWNNGGTAVVCSTAGTYCEEVPLQRLVHGSLHIAAQGQSQAVAKPGEHQQHMHEIDDSGAVEQLETAAAKSKRLIALNLLATIIKRRSTPRILKNKAVEKTVGLGIPSSAQQEIDCLTAISSAVEDEAARLEQSGKAIIKESAFRMRQYSVPRIKQDIPDGQAARAAIAARQKIADSVPLEETSNLVVADRTNGSGAIDAAGIKLLDATMPNVRSCDDINRPADSSHHMLQQQTLGCKLYTPEEQRRTGSFWDIPGHQWEKEGCTTLLVPLRPGEIRVLSHTVHSALVAGRKLVMARYRQSMCTNPISFSPVRIISTTPMSDLIRRRYERAISEYIGSNSEGGKLDLDRLPETLPVLPGCEVFDIPPDDKRKGLAKQAGARGWRLARYKNDTERGCALRDKDGDPVMNDPVPPFTVLGPYQCLQLLEKGMKSMMVDRHLMARVGCNLRAEMSLFVDSYAADTELVTDEKRTFHVAHRKLVIDTLKLSSKRQLVYSAACYGNETALINDGCLKPFDDDDDEDHDLNTGFGHDGPDRCGGKERCSSDLPVNTLMVEVLIGGWPHLFLVTCSKVTPGTEFILSYGDMYWKLIEERLEELKHARMDEELRPRESSQQQISSQAPQPDATHLPTQGSGVNPISFAAAEEAGITPCGENPKRKTTEQVQQTGRAVPCRTSNKGAEKERPQLQSVRFARQCNTLGKHAVKGKSADEGRPAAAAELGRAGSFSPSSHPQVDTETDETGAAARLKQEPEIEGAVVVKVAQSHLMMSSGLDVGCKHSAGEDEAQKHGGARSRPLGTHNSALGLVWQKSKEPLEVSQKETEKGEKLKKVRSRSRSHSGGRRDAGKRKVSPNQTQHMNKPLIPRRSQTIPDRDLPMSPLGSPRPSSEGLKGGRPGGAPCRESIGRSGRQALRRMEQQSRAGSRRRTRSRSRRRDQDRSTRRAGESAERGRREAVDGHKRRQRSHSRSRERLHGGEKLWGRLGWQTSPPAPSALHSPAQLPGGSMAADGSWARQGVHGQHVLSHPVPVRPQAQQQVFRRGRAFASNAAHPAMRPPPFCQQAPQLVQQAPSQHVPTMSQPAWAARPPALAGHIATGVPSNHVPAAANHPQSSAQLLGRMYSSWENDGGWELPSPDGSPRVAAQTTTNHVDATAGRPYPVPHLHMSSHHTSSQPIVLQPVNQPMVHAPGQAGQLGGPQPGVQATHQQLALPQQGHLAYSHMGQQHGRHQQGYQNHWQQQHHGVPVQPAAAAHPSSRLQELFSADGEWELPSPRAGTDNSEGGNEGGGDSTPDIMDLEDPPGRHGASGGGCFDDPQTPDLSTVNIVNPGPQQPAGQEPNGAASSCERLQMVPSTQLQGQGTQCQVQSLPKGRENNMCNISKTPGRPTAAGGKHANQEQEQQQARASTEGMARPFTDPALQRCKNWGVQQPGIDRAAPTGELHNEHSNVSASRRHPESRDVPVPCAQWARCGTSGEAGNTDGVDAPGVVMRALPGIGPDRRSRASAGTRAIQKEILVNSSRSDSVGPSLCPGTAAGELEAAASAGVGQQLLQSLDSTGTNLTNAAAAGVDGKHKRQWIRLPKQPSMSGDMQFGGRSSIGPEEGICASQPKVLRRRELLERKAAHAVSTAVPVGRMGATTEQHAASLRGLGRRNSQTHRKID